MGCHFAICRTQLVRPPRYRDQRHPCQVAFAQPARGRINRGGASLALRGFHSSDARSTSFHPRPGPRDQKV